MADKGCAARAVNVQSKASSIEADEVTIDADFLASSLHKLTRRNLSVSQQTCIFKIPNILHRHNPKAYVPNAFSIGPWHHDQEHLKPAEDIKLNYLKRLISRSPSPERKLEEFVQAIRKVEKDARARYAGPVDMSVDDFVKLLVIDGCFIIELFRKDNLAEKSKDEYDPIFNMSCMQQYLRHDLILLENQIPWFVLKLLFNMSTEPSLSVSLEHLAINFFRNIFSSEPPPEIKSYQGNIHILDLLREWLVSSSGKAAHRKEGWESMPSAKTLEEAGIEFKKSKSKSILDIEFKNGVLAVPSILIQETTEDIFRNLISFEQCYSNCSAIITSYAILLDNLINTEKDVEILSEKGIMENWLNPQDATQFFNKLYHDAYLKENYYLKLCNDVNEYSHRFWPTWRAAFIHNYLGKPWAIASVTVAGFILILTILQTVFSIIK